MIDFSDGYTRVGWAEMELNEIEDKIIKDEICSLKVSVRRTVSRWNRELLGKDYQFELEEGIFSFLVTRIDKTPMFGILIEGYYLTHSAKDEWWHVSMIVSKIGDDTSIRITRCFTPHYLSVKRYKETSKRINAPL